jgi:hypothetical protein
MKLSIIKEGKVVVAVAPNKDHSLEETKSSEAAPFTGIAPLKGQKLFELDVHKDLAHSLLSADNSETVEKLLRGHRLVEVKSKVPLRPKPKR